MTALNPSREEFVALAKEGNVIPVFAEFISDVETPVSAFSKLYRGCSRGRRPRQKKQSYSFLFESTEKNDVSGRFYFLGTEPRGIIRSFGRQIHLVEDGRERRFQAANSPLDEARKLLGRYRFVAHPELPRFCGGAVGFLGYDAISFFEPSVPLAPADELRLPEMLFMITRSLLVFDHRLRSLKIVVNAFLEDGDPEQVYAQAQSSIALILRELDSPANLRALPIKPKTVPASRSNFDRSEFERAVERAKDYIGAGDIFQVVVSQRFECEFSGSALDFYRCLRFINPSPYMFCLNFGSEFALLGSSPEMHVRLSDGVIDIRPIAGTRPRGETIAQDETNARELLADAKERAEHIMLVDLARNDVGRVAEFGSVKVSEFMEIERYSHVMHIVSNVRGRLRPECDGLDLLRATFPAGTVSGAPKIRAMQIINELEKTRRGCYAGAVGYFGFDGNLDSCIVLRSAVLKSGKAYFQAGAGVVADSDPQREYAETINKARAMMQALALASR